MSLPLILTLVVVVPLVSAAILTVGSRSLLRGRPALLTNEGGSPALRAITACYSLTLAFVLASALTTFLSARQQTVNEADTVVAIGNLAPKLRPLAASVVLRELSCYADTVANKEFAKEQAGLDVPDDNVPLQRLYQCFPISTRRARRRLSITEAMLSAARSADHCPRQPDPRGPQFVARTAVVGRDRRRRRPRAGRRRSHGSRASLGSILRAHRRGGDRDRRARADRVAGSSVHRPAVDQREADESALAAVSQTSQKPYCVSTFLTG